MTTRVLSNLIQIQEKIVYREEIVNTYRETRWERDHDGGGRGRWEGKREAFPYVLTAFHLQLSRTDYTDINS